MIRLNVPGYSGEESLQGPAHEGGRHEVERATWAHVDESAEANRQHVRVPETAPAPARPRGRAKTGSGGAGG